MNRQPRLWSAHTRCAITRDSVRSASIRPGPFGLGIQHPFLSATLIGRGKAEGLLHAAPEILLGKALRPFLSNRGECCGAQQRHEQEIVEMARLQRGVLAIVGEAEELALVGRNRAAGAIHPAQRARHQQGRRRAPPFGRQARELVDLARLARRLILAGRAEAELAGQEPRPTSGCPDCSAGIDRDFPRRRTAPVAAEPNAAARAGLEPVLGIILQGAGERIIGVVLRLRHQIARLLAVLGIVERRFVDGARKHAGNPAIFDQNDRVMFLPAVPAEEGGVKPRVGILRVEALAVERDPPLARCRAALHRHARTGDEAVELEGKKRPLTAAAPLARRAAHHHQHRLKLRPATLLIAPGLVRQPLRGFGEGGRRAASKLLTVLQPDLELDPDGERMRREAPHR